MINVRRTPFSA